MSLTAVSVRSDIDELLNRIKKISDDHGKYLTMNAADILNGSIDVHEIIDKIKQYTEECDQIHEEIDSYIMDTMKYMTHQPFQDDNASIMYMLSNLRKLNNNSKEQHITFKQHMVPALMMLKSLGVE